MPVSALDRPVELSRQPAEARRQLARLLGGEGWPGDVDSAVLALHEAMVNSQRHGGGVTGATACLDGRSLVVRVCDRGRGFEVPESLELADTTAERGRGLFLIRQLSSDAHVARAGDEVELTMTFGP